MILGNRLYRVLNELSAFVEVVSRQEEKSQLSFLDNNKETINLFANELFEIRDKSYFDNEPINKIQAQSMYNKISYSANQAWNTLIIISGFSYSQLSEIEKTMIVLCDNLEWERMMLRKTIGNYCKNDEEILEDTQLLNFYPTKEKQKEYAINFVKMARNLPYKNKGIVECFFQNVDWGTFCYNYRRLKRNGMFLMMKRNGIKCNEDVFSMSTIKGCCSKEQYELLQEELNKYKR